MEGKDKKYVGAFKIALKLLRHAGSIPDALCQICLVANYGSTRANLLTPDNSSVTPTGGHEPPIACLWCM